MKLTFKKIMSIVAVFALAISLAGCSKLASATAKELLEEGLPEHFEKAGLGGKLIVDKVDNVTMVKSQGNEYKGLADVTLSTRSRSMTKTIRYDLKGTMDLSSGGDMLLEFNPAESDLMTFVEIATRAEQE